MIEDLDKFVRFMTKYNINAHQFMLPYMLHMDERRKAGIRKYESSGTAMANLFKYKYNSGGWSLDDLKYLEEKGLITGLTKVDTTGRKVIVEPEMIEPTQEFRDNIFAPETRFEEFLETYPVTITHFNDPRKGDIPLQIVDSLDELEDLYNRLVKTKVLHERIIDLVQWAKEQGLITMNIKKFVASRHWRVLEKQKIDHLDITEGYGLKRP